MYQRLVAVLFIGALGMAAYFVHHSNIDEIVAMSNSDNQIAITSPDDIAGLYVCTTKTGCLVPYRLTLTQSGKAKLDTIGTSTKSDKTESLKDVPVDNSDANESVPQVAVPVSATIGSWQVIPGGFVEISYTADNDENGTDEMKTLIAQTITPSFLTKFIYNKQAYPSLKKPRFVREDLLR
jgi:hypothetical protein